MHRLVTNRSGGGDGHRLQRMRGKAMAQKSIEKEGGRVERGRE